MTRMTRGFTLLALLILLVGTWGLLPARSSGEATYTYSGNSTVNPEHTLILHLTKHPATGNYTVTGTVKLSTRLGGLGDSFITGTVKGTYFPTTKRLKARLFTSKKTGFEALSTNIDGKLDDAHNRLVVSIMSREKNTEVMQFICSLQKSDAEANAEQETKELKSIAGTWRSDWGPVTIEYGAVETGAPIKLTGYWQQGADKRGIIKKGTFNPSSGTVEFSYYQHWNNITGTAQLTLSEDGKTLSGKWQQPGNSGSWTMTR